MLLCSFVQVRSEDYSCLTLRCDAIRVRLRRQPSDGVALSQGRSVGERSSRIPDENRRSSAGGAVDRDGANSRKRLRARSLPRPPTAARGIAGLGSEKGTRNFPACNALKRRKTWKFSRRPRTGWEQPNEGVEALRSPQYLHAPERRSATRRRGMPALGQNGCAAPKNGMRKFSCLQRIEKAQNVKIFSAEEDGLGAISQTAEALRSSPYLHPPRSGASFDREAGDRDLT